MAAWVKSCDERGVDPSCLGCERPLSDAAIGLILGAEEHARRGERLVERLGFLSCPSPGCGARFELEDGVGKATTTCPRCRRAVSVGATTLSELLGEDAVVDAAEAAVDASDAAAELLLKKPSIKRCPGCRQAVEKVARSCNKFKCRCGTKFCWKCDARADERGQLSCHCTDDSHVFWDNVKEKPELVRSPRAAPAAKRRRQH